MVQGTVRTLGVVERNVLGNAMPECCLRAVLPAIQLLPLHGGEKGFNYCIVVRLTGTGQRLDHGVFV